MYEATLAEAERRFGTRNPVFNYRWEHVLAVHTLALRLARLTGADADVVEAAVWLHDIAKDTGTDHPQEGADFARAFLPVTDFPPEKIEPVAEAIAAHMGLWLDEPLSTLEAQVLWDADKLAKLGVTAAIHWLGLDFANGKSMTTVALLERNQNIGWMEKTVASMHTAAGKAAAARRLAAFDQIWSQLEGELSAGDLSAAGSSG
jgi:uncharacterized protein